MKDLNGHGWLRRRLVRWLFGAPIRSIHATRLRPGDTLVLNLGYPVSAEGMARVYEHLRQAVPDGVKVLAIEPNAVVSIWRETMEEEHDQAERRTLRDRLVDAYCESLVAATAERMAEELVSRVAEGIDSSGAGGLMKERGDRGVES